MEMSSDECKAQPWIFFGVDGDEDYSVGLVFWFSALGEDGRERDKEGREGIKKRLKNCYLISGQRFLSLKTQIPNTYFIFFKH